MSPARTGIARPSKSSDGHGPGWSPCRAPRVPAPAARMVEPALVLARNVPAQPDAREVAVRGIGEFAPEPKLGVGAAPAVRARDPDAHLSGRPGRDARLGAGWWEHHPSRAETRWTKSLITARYASASFSRIVQWLELPKMMNSLSAIPRPGFGGSRPSPRRTSRRGSGQAPGSHRAGP